MYIKESKVAETLNENMFFSDGVLSILLLFKNRIVDIIFLVSFI